MKKKNKVILVSILILLLILGSLFFLWYTGRISFRKTIYYKNYGISIPKDYQLHGIDVSRYQGEIHWKQVKEVNFNNVKIDFVMIKSTEGLSYRDLTFERNWLEAKRHGLLRGSYHFFHPSKDPIAQAQHFFKHTPLSKGDLAPMVDIESTDDLPLDKLNENLKIYLKLLEYKFKCKPIIYTYSDFYKKNIDTSFNSYPLWIAHYVTSDKPNASRSWNIWQFSDKATVNGIPNKVDFNVVNGNLSDLRKLTIP